MSPAIVAPGEDGDRIFLVTPAPSDVQRAFNDFIIAHMPELEIALEGTGYTVGDIMQPTWMRAVRADELAFGGTDLEIRNAAGDVVRSVNHEIAMRGKFADHGVTK